jgi:Uma2 family endonuclease
MTTLEAPTTWETVPLLENGDVLHAREFLRRYERMADTKKAELIEGIVCMGSPVSVKHAEADSLIQGWLLAYAARNRQVRVAANVTVLLDPENTVQPDALLRLLPEHGGQCRPGEKGYLRGAPELIVEVAASSASVDLHDKRRAYERNGVKEYLVWRVLEGQLDWFGLEEDEYVALLPDAAGLTRSKVFPGLNLNVPALLAGDVGGVLAALELRTEK